MTSSMHDQHADHGHAPREPGNVAPQNGQQDRASHPEQSATGGGINAMAASATLHCA